DQYLAVADGRIHQDSQGRAAQPGQLLVLAGGGEIGAQRHSVTLPVNPLPNACHIRPGRAPGADEPPPRDENLVTGDERETRLTIAGDVVASKRLGGRGYDALAASEIVNPLPPPGSAGAAGQGRTCQPGPCDQGLCQCGRPKRPGPAGRRR